MVQTNLNPLARASAVNVAFQQMAQNVSPTARPEKIVVIGNAQDGKTVTTNKLFLASGNPDDIGVQFGFGSPLHRMAEKLFPQNRNGSKVDTYFMAVAEPTGGAAHVLDVNITGTASKSFTCYFRYKELEFEAAADVAGKVATNAQLNPAKDPRGIDLDIFNRISIPFTITNAMDETAICNSLIAALNDHVDIPFTAAYVATQLVLTSKWKGSSSVFEVDFVDEKGNTITSTDYGISFATTIGTPAAGLVDLTTILPNITTIYQITRVVSQFNDAASLNALKNYFMGLRDGLIAQYALCYIGMKYPESGTVPGTVDLTTLQTLGDGRRDDSVNVLIAADYGDLRHLEYESRDTLLKAGISNLEPKINGSFRIGDLATFYHPQGVAEPLFKFDRDITLIGNTAYDLMSKFRDSEDWKSIIIVADNDVTVNPEAKKLSDVQAAVNATLRNWSKYAWIADLEFALNNTIAVIDPGNSNRIDIQPGWYLSSVGRIFDINNFVGFYFGNS